MNIIGSFRITFKFGGYWKEIKRHSRVKYEGGNQKTITFQKNMLSFFVVKGEIEKICPSLHGHDFEFHFHISGTSPKAYMPIKSDIEVMEMIRLSEIESRAEIVVIYQDWKEAAISSQDRQVLDDCNLEMYHPTSESGDDNVVHAEDAIDVGFTLNQNIEDIPLAVGLRFDDSNILKQVLRTEAIKNNFALKITASERTRVIAICAHRGCPWRIRAALCSDGQSFEVRKLDGRHLCPGVNRAGNKLATSNWVAYQIQDIVKRNPDISPRDINNNLENTFGLSLPYMKVWRSREQARDMIFGSVDDNYKWVPTLREELLRRNPGSHVTYTYDIHDNAFQRFFVSFKVCTNGFLLGCRPLIGLDACHLKSKYLGVLLSANSLDGNNGIFTIAFAVVETESKSTWQWFLRNLAQVIRGNVEHLAFISDMEKGLAEALKNTFPEAEHRVCIRHLWKNMKKFFHCDESSRVRSLVWTASNATAQYEFDSKIDALLHMSPQVHSYLLALPYKWSKSQFSVHIRNAHNTNNVSESFNAWIAEARAKPVVDLVNMIRGMLMVQRAQRKMSSLTWKGELVPYADEYIREITTRKEQFIVKPSTSSKAEVEGKYACHEVDIANKTCSCGLWEVTGLPCIHAVAFIGSKEHISWEVYVDDYYHVGRYRLAYEGAIATLPGKEQWIQPADVVHIEVPKTLRPRGRPRKRRMLSFLENQGNTRSKTVHKCGRCGLYGHHRSTCKNPLDHQAVDQRQSLSTTNDGVAARSKLPLRRSTPGCSTDIVQ